MKITHANLEFISTDVYLTVKALVPVVNYKSWQLIENQNKNEDAKGNRILFFLFKSQDMQSSYQLKLKEKFFFYFSIFGCWKRNKL